jgi:hypothetical protein
MTESQDESGVENRGQDACSPLSIVTLTRVVRQVNDAIHPQNLAMPLGEGSGN